MISRTSLTTTFSSAPNRMQGRRSEALYFSGQTSQPSTPSPQVHSQGLLKRAMDGVKQFVSKLWELLTFQFLRDNPRTAEGAFSRLERLAGPDVSSASLGEIKQFSLRVEDFADSLTRKERRGGFASLAPEKKEALLGLTYDAMRSEIPEIKCWGTSLAGHLGINEHSIQEVTMEGPTVNSPDPLWDTFTRQVQTAVSRIPAEYRQKTYKELPEEMKSGIRNLVNYQATADSPHPKIEAWISKYALALGIVQTTPAQPPIPVGSIKPDLV